MTESLVTEIQDWPELCEYIERGSVIGESTSWALSVTGEVYVEFCLGAPTKTLLADGMKAVFNEYKRGHKGVLYWRVKPEIQERGGIYKGYMRLLISDKTRISDG